MTRFIWLGGIAVFMFVAGLAGARLVGNPVSAFRAYRVAAAFMEAWKRGQHQVLVPMLDQSTRTRIRNEGDVLEQQLPRIQDFSVRTLSWDAHRRAYRVRFHIASSAAGQATLVLKEENGVFVVAYADPPGI